MKAENINKGWQLEENWKTADIDLPYDFMLRHERKPGSVTGMDEGFFEPGRAVYRKKITLSEKKANYFLRFDGVMGLCEVYVNGGLVKLHPYGYTPFICSASMREGENEIEVRVDAAKKPSS